MNFNLTVYDLALVAGGFTIVGALLGNWVSHRFSDYRDRRKNSMKRPKTFSSSSPTSIAISETLRKSLKN